MNILELFARQLAWQFARTIDWALTNWWITMLLLVALIYWAGRQRRLNRHHL
ncbi:MAG: hypothetical protein ACREPG_12610 [Candidatus Binatia bacterium]